MPSRCDYKGWNFAEDFLAPLQELEDFQADPSDVVICTSPRSGRVEERIAKLCNDVFFELKGTHLTAAIVWMLLHDADPDCLKNGVLEENVPYVDGPWPIQGDLTGVQMIKKRQAPRAFYTHLGFDGLPDSIKQTAKVGSAKYGREVPYFVFADRLRRKKRKGCNCILLSLHEGKPHS